MSGRQLSYMALVGLSAASMPGVGQLRAQAPRAAAGITLGTTGIGAQVAGSLNRYLSIRTGFSYLQLGIGAKSLEGISYDMKPRVQNIPLVLDVHPFGSAFRIAGGVVFNQNRLNSQAVLDGPTVIGENSYNPEQVTQLAGRIRGRTTSPYLGLGFDGMATRKGRVGMTFELGALFHGNPESTLEGATSLSGAARDQFQADVESENAEIQQKIHDQPKVIRLFPVLNIGLNVRLR